MLDFMLLTLNQELMGSSNFKTRKTWDINLHLNIKSFIRMLIKE